MGLDIKKAYGSPFSEKEWHNKLIFPVIMNFCILVLNMDFHIQKNFLVILSLISIFLSIALFGYFIQFQHNEIHDKMPLLPDFKGKIKSYFIWGFKLIVITLSYLLLGLTIFIIASIILKFGGIISALAKIVLTISLFFLFIAALFSQSSYANDFSFKNSLNLIRISKLMSKVKFEIFIFILFAFPLCVLINDLSKNKNIMLIIFSSVLTSILQLVLNNLNAKLFKLSKNKLDNIVCENSKNEIASPKVSQ